MRRRKAWSYSAGSKPDTVRVFEREPGGVLYVRAWDPTRRGGKGDWCKRSLGHRDRESAEAYALEQAAMLKKGDEELKAGTLTLARVLGLYVTHRTPRKTEQEQRSDARRIEVWTRVLGAGKDPHKVSLGEWESFIDARRCGSIDARGRPVPEGDRRSVRPRAVEADCKWLRWVFNWATRWRTQGGHYLMRENPVRGYEIPTEKNPRRPVATWDRYEALRAVSDQVSMEERWAGRRETRRSHLSEILDLAAGTGRRISSVCQLRFEDLQLQRAASRPHGAITWRADADKMGIETTIPVSEMVRRAIDRILEERPGLGAAPLFPKPEDPAKPITRYLASEWLQQAEKLAGLEPQQGGLWHPFRRMWATARKGLPVQDVAQAGGWKSAETVARIYQQADDTTTLEVVLCEARVQERAQ